VVALDLSIGQLTLLPHDHDDATLHPDDAYLHAPYQLLAVVVVEVAVVVAMECLVT
jgi:hypothetical protein